MMVASFDFDGPRLESARTSRRANATALPRSDLVRGLNLPLVRGLREGARGRSAGNAVECARRAAVAFVAARLGAAEEAPVPLRTPILPARAS